MKLFCLIFSSFLLTTVCKAQSFDFPKPQLSASAQLYLWKIEQSGNTDKSIFPENVYRLDAAGNTYVNTMIQVYPGFTDAPLKALGVKVGTKAGNIWTAQVPQNKIKDFIKVQGIKYIEMDQPAAPQLDSARKFTKVDSVHGGYGLPQAYNGNNVVIGIIDAGFDYTHPTFYDTSFAAYRVKRVWEEKTIGTPPASYAYGAEYQDSLSIVNKGYDIYTGTHGAHVAGIAGGSGLCGPGGSTSRYRGVAYKSDLVFVGIYPTSAYWLNTGMADMLDGINYTFDYAASVSKPAVANLSWSCPLGPRDGNSLFSQACNNLVGPGKIFVLSGGNNGGKRIHLQKTFTSTDSAVHTVVTLPVVNSKSVNWIDVWGDTAKPFRVRFSTYFGSTRIDSCVKISLDNTVHQIKLKTNTGDTCFITVSTVASEFNSKPHMLIQIYNRTATNKVMMSLYGQSGTIDAWQGLVDKTTGYYGTFIKNVFTFASDGDLIMQPGDLASTENSIAVAAYTSKPSFTNVSGATLSYSGYTKGAIANFSSIGPTADGRLKPEITGPGMALASSINIVDSTYLSGGSNYNTVVSQYVSPLNGRTYSYAMAGGTSMSGPAVAGIVALLLEVSPTLTPAQVKYLLKLSAITDSYTGVIPANGSTTWGWGKANAYKAVQLLLQGVGIHHLENTNLNCIVFPNPTANNYSIEYVAEKQETIDITVNDISGKTLIKTSWDVIPGNNKKSLDIADRSAGVYFTNLQSKTGKAVVKIIKQ